MACSVCGGAGAYEAEYRWPDGRVHRQVEPCGDCGVVVNREWRRTIPLRAFLGMFPALPDGATAEAYLDKLHNPAR